MTRPRGSPPMPSAISSPSEPVETTSTSIAASRDPSFIIEPLPNARSIWPSAASNARCLSIVSLSRRRNTGWFISPLRYPTGGAAAQTHDPKMNVRFLFLEHNSNFCIFVRLMQCGTDSGSPPSPGRRFGPRRPNAKTPALCRGFSVDDFLDLCGELFQRKGLWQEVDVAVAVEPLAERILGVAGDEDDLHIGVGFAHLAHQAGPVHLWHHDIGDQQIDRLGGGAHQLERGLAAARFKHGIAFVA